MGGSFTIRDKSTRGIKKGDWIVFRLTNDGAGHSTGAVMGVRSNMKEGDDLFSIHLPFVNDAGDAVDFLFSHFQIIGNDATLMRNLGGWESASRDVVFQVVDYPE